MKEIKIENYTIGSNQKPFIIAELSCNHNQSVDLAFKIVEAAAEAGVQAIKLQTYTADTLTLDVDGPDFRINDKKSLWNGYRLYDLYKKAYTPWEWHKPIMEKAQKLGMVFFSTAFDKTSVDFLEELKVPVHKIASFENRNIPLIEYAASKGKPLIISTGMASLEELDEAVGAARRAGCKELILLKCTSAYPANPADSNLLTIPDIKNRFQCEVGFSDHTLGSGAAAASVALGAKVIEKHLKLEGDEKSLDAAFSLDPKQMLTFAKDINDAWQALGNVNYGSLASEETSLQERNSIYISIDMKEGEIFTEKNIRCIRPGFGLHPRYYKKVLGKKASREAIKGERLTLDLIEGGKL